jgi:hypothetical protein
MRAHKSTTTTRRPRSAWRTLISLAVLACALAVPATASARPIDSGPYTVSTSQSGVPNLNQATIGHPSATIGRPNEGFVPADHLRYTGPVLDTPSQPIAAGDGFDWGDAGLGAAAAFGLAVLAAGAVVIRRRTGLEPSAS